MKKDYVKKQRFSMTKYLFVLFIILTINVKAQYNFVQPPNPSTYDLLYLFDTNYITMCFSTDNQMQVEFDYDTPWGVQHLAPPNIEYSKPYSEFGWYNVKNQEWCNPNAPVPDGYVIGANSIENQTKPYATAFAQEYNFLVGDIPYNEYVVVGVAIKLAGEQSYEDNYLHILNQNFDTLATTLFHTWDIIPNPNDPNTTIHWNPWDWNTYYFPSQYYDTLTNINNFLIAFDVPMYANGNHFRVIHTCNVYSPCIRDSINALGGAIQAGLCYDTIVMGSIHYYSEAYQEFIQNPPEEGEVNYLYQGWLEYIKQFSEEDNIPLCRFNNSKYLKHDDEWINFEDDPVYEIWRNIRIAMVPIIMVPQQQQALTEVELQKMCYLVPNPTRDYFKALSHYTINSVQVFDLAGKLLIEEKLNHFEALIDVSDFTAGTYIVKINTVKGSVEKKMIVQ
ncbi:MAG: T9SS type A sorting domain-containing protein [Bacteroidales bacterium]|nr:T9SS type A sorting domain-containing protein [Bacteroidales bacterium]